jgi:hypothetical protein
MVQTSNFFSPSSFFWIRDERPGSATLMCRYRYYTKHLLTNNKNVAAFHQDCGTAIISLSPDPEF